MRTCNWNTSATEKQIGAHAGFHFLNQCTRRGNLEIPLPRKAKIFGGRVVRFYGFICTRILASTNIFEYRTTNTSRNFTSEPQPECRIYQSDELGRYTLAGELSSGKPLREFPVWNTRIENRQFESRHPPTTLLPRARRTRIYFRRLAHSRDPSSQRTPDIPNTPVATGSVFNEFASTHARIRSRALVSTSSHSLPRSRDPHK